jgi:diguanylate cyclase
VARQSSYPPVYTEETEQASENLRLALPLINKHKTAANPVNYAVWYEYVSGENIELANAIDKILADNKPITTEITQTLFEQFVLMGMPERLEHTNQGLKLVVDNTLTDINEVESTTNQCISGFSDSQMALEDCNDVSDLKSLLGNIIADTHKMSMTSTALKDSLEQSAQEIAKLKEELNAVKKSARMDALTGLLNRGSFNTEIEKVCEQDETDTALLLFDIDHFKNINDTFGHLLGDKVIQYFGKLLQKHTPENSHTARYGGEEMAMILLNVSEQEAFALAEKVRLNFANSRLKKRGSEETIGQITTSVGISMKKPVDTPADIIERADNALYSAKQNGRNRVVFN